MPAAGPSLAGRGRGAALLAPARGLFRGIPKQNNKRLLQFEPWPVDQSNGAGVAAGRSQGWPGPVILLPAAGSRGRAGGVTARVRPPPATPT